MKRKFTWALLALTVALGVVLFLWQRDSISRASYGNIRLGMTLAEAEAVVGHPSTGLPAIMDELFKKRRVKWKDASAEGIIKEGSDWSAVPPADLNRIRCWEFVDGGIAVQLDDNERVNGKRFEERPGYGLVDRFRMMLGI